MRVCMRPKKMPSPGDGIRHLFDAKMLVQSMVHTAGLFKSHCVHKASGQGPLQNLQGTSTVLFQAIDIPIFHATKLLFCQLHFSIVRIFWVAALHGCLLSCINQYFSTVLDPQKFLFCFLLVIPDQHEQQPIRNGFRSLSRVDFILINVCQQFLLLTITHSCSWLLLITIYQRQENLSATHLLGALGQQ